MKFYYLFLLLFFFNTYSQKQNQTFGFIENKGQIVDQKGRKNNAVKYLLNTSGLNVQLRENGFSYDVYEIKKHPLTKKQKEVLYPYHFIKKDTLKNPNYTVEYIYHRIDIDFENSNRTVKLIAEEKSSDYDNYYNIPTEPNGVVDVHKFQKITYKNIYNKIDVVFFMPSDKSKPVEYNIIVNEGGKISDIQLNFKGVKTELIDNKIKMNVRFGQMEETMPLSWTEIGGAKKEITIGYKKIKNNVYGLDSSMDLNNKKIVIDPTPVRLWGTFYGGEREEYNLSLEKDLQGDVYICGSTSSKDFIATAGAYQTVFGSINYYSPSLYITDGFIAKFDTNGNRLWSTFYGGWHNDSVTDISISSNNMIAFCGNTNSDSNIATQGSFKDFKSSSYEEMYFGLLNANGIRIWCTYFGDYSGRSFMNTITFDANDNIYVAGTTSAVNYIATPNSFKSTPPTSFYDFDGFISKFTLNGNQVWGSYYGGDGGDFIEDLIFDFNNNNIIAVGYTDSISGIASQNAFQQSLADLNSSNIGNDGFILNFTTNGTRNWGTYFGGNKADKILRVKSFNNSLYISGESNSDNLATPNAFETNQSYNGISFIAKFDMPNQQKTWFSYSSGKITDIDINQNEEIYIVGESNSLITNIATANAFNPIPNGFGSYIRKINNNCQIIWGTYLGDSGFALNPYVKNINNDLFYVSGTCWALNLSINYGLTTTNSYQEFSKDGHESYINKFKDCLSVTTITSNTPTCIGANIQLTATGGTNYSWIGPNGFTSNLQNPTITNATTLNAGVYSCNITGTGGCDGSNSTTVIIGDLVKPVPNTTQLPNIIGDCTTSITAPTALDNCAGTITATTSDPLSYSLPGTYTIHWNYNDGNGNMETQTQYVIINSVALPNVNSPQTFCIQQNATLSTIIISGTNIKWFDAATGGNLLANSTILVNGTTYFATQTINGCESFRVPITISIQNTPAPTGATNQILCSNTNPTLSTISTSGTAINWYATNTSTTILPNTTALINGANYYATQTINSCESVNRLAVNVTLITSLNANNYSQSFCDDLNNGTENVVLSNYNSNLITSTTGITFSYYTSLASAENQIIYDELSLNYNLSLGLHTVYVRLDSTNGCHQVVELNLSLFPKPIIIIEDIIPICSGTTIVVNAGSGFNSYNWSTGATSQTISITTPGTYSVTVTKNYGLQICSSTKTFTVVLSQIATITSITTEDWTDIENVIIVNTTGNGIYQYSIDAINYQDSNTFIGLLSGLYTVYVRDKNDCGIVDENVFLLNYPKYFTPNNDGFNDFWRIKFSQVEPDLTVSILDRYGKLITTLKSNSPGWDGTYNGKQMPSDDYWFVVKREKGQEHRAHFALKR